MLAVERYHLVHFAMVIIAVLYPFASHHAAHAVTDKDVAGCELSVKVGILADDLKSVLSKVRGILPNMYNARRQTHTAIGALMAGHGS